jgi:iron complex outermembrane receptor protein
VPTTTVGGVDLTNIANYTGGSYAYDTEQHFNGHEGAYKLDAEYSLGSGFFSSLTAGARVANRNLNYQVFTMFGGLKPANIQANPAWFGLTPGDVLFSKTQGSAIEPKFTTFNPDLLHNNLAGVSQTLGLPAVAAAPLQDYNADEKNYSGYFRANFQADLGIPIDGNIGVRVVRVEEFLTGYTGTTAAPTPINFSNGQTNPLPSLNIRFKLRDDLQLRVAASKVVSYPDFTQIRPAISLLPAQQSATGGNPNLKPTKANQVDSSLEWYFAPASSVYADVFYKKVQNFIFQTTTPNAFTINGITYNLTGPATGPAGTIKGAEVGYQQFFDFLPGLWSGLGAQLNYTYVDAAAPTAVAGTTTTLPGLSKNAFNAIGIYEKGPVSFRLAYGWRSQFYTTIYTGATAQLAANPIFTHQFGWLDSSFTYDVTNQWSAYVQGSNLLRTRLTTFYGAGTRPDGNTIDDRQYLVGVRFKF